MGREVFLLCTISFILIFVGMINYAPIELFNSGYTSPDIDIPDEFEAWEIIPHEMYEEKNFTYPTGVFTSDTIYDFTDESNDTSLMFGFEWTNNKIEIDRIKYTIGLIYIGQIMEPSPIYKERLVTSWNNQYNYSLVYFFDAKGRIEAYFEDNNSTRNNIASAWDDGHLNCTISIPSASQRGEYIGARDIIVALLTFRIPSVFATASPLFGFLLSILFYVPIAISFFIVIIMLLHG